MIAILPPPIDAHRLVWITLASVFGALFLVELYVGFAFLADGDGAVIVELGRRWRESGTMYLDWQLAGPYSVWATTIEGTPGLYPPAAGPLFGALSLVPWPLFAPLWRVVPLVILGTVVVRQRPAPWAWAVMLLLLATPASVRAILAGSSTVWAAAFVALGGGWAALLLLKPVLAPFALVGAARRADASPRNRDLNPGPPPTASQRRCSTAELSRGLIDPSAYRTALRGWTVNPRWWVVAGATVLLTLAGPWHDYIAVTTNAQGLDYVIGNYPLLLVPVVASLGAAGRSPARWPSRSRGASGPERSAPAR